MGYSRVKGAIASHSWFLLQLMVGRAEKGRKREKTPAGSALDVPSAGHGRRRHSWTKTFQFLEAVGQTRCGKEDSCFHNAAAGFNGCALLSPQPCSTHAAIR